MCGPETLRSLVADPLQKAWPPALQVPGNALEASPTSAHAILRRPTEVASPSTLPQPKKMKNAC